jgi:hypothetical protein
MNAGSPTRTASSSPTTTIRWKAAKSEAYRKLFLERIAFDLLLR